MARSRTQRQQEISSSSIASAAASASNKRSRTSSSSEVATVATAANKKSKTTTTSSSSVTASASEKKVIDNREEDEEVKLLTPFHSISDEEDESDNPIEVLSVSSTSEVEVQRSLPPQPTSTSTSCKTQEQPKNEEKTKNQNKNKKAATRALAPAVATTATTMSSGEEDDEFLYDDEDEDDLMEGNDEPAYSETSENIDDAAGMVDDEEDGYDGFDVTAGESQTQKKPYEIAYQIKTIEELQAEQRDLVNRVSALVECDPSSAATLLRFYNWNPEKLQEVYWEDPAKALHDAGLSPPSSPTTQTTSLPQPPRPSRANSSNAVASSSKVASAKSARSKVPATAPQEPFECPICCSEYGPDPAEIERETLCMGCEHRFCRGCWEGYLNQKIMEEAESGRVQCMESGCGRIVSEKVVESIISGRVAERYRELLDRTYVDNNQNLKWCPHPDCEYACYTSQAPPRKLEQIIPTVHCLGNHDWCFGCGYQGDHRPLICKYVKLWEKKCADDSETSNWLMANTKECAKCASTIEKNGGCNHMTCKKCRYEFCWVCLADWTSHGTSWYNCNRYDEKAGVEARDAQAQSRKALERYLHYHTRFANHQQSARLDKQLYQKTERKMEIIQQQTDLSWIEVQYIKRAADVLLASRHVLAWSYAMAFYLKRTNLSEIFEDHQGALETATEELSGLLEQNIDVDTIHKIRAEITNKTNFLKSRASTMLEDTLQGHLEGRWEFNQ